ncbi:hypothetical protein [Nostoc sp. WHI]|nr:hypothetical protein [Nostoc sp. WHI]
MNITSSSDEDVPIFSHISDGNESEKSRFPFDRKRSDINQHRQSTTVES